MARATKAKTAKNPIEAVLPDKERAVRAALTLSGQIGWDMLTLADIAGEAGLSLARLAELFDDKGDILTTYGRGIDKKVLERLGAPVTGGSERERVFEVLMERFDVLNEDRAALVSILSSFKLDPKQMVISLPHLGRSMGWMLEAAGIDTAGIKGALRLAGLSGLYVWVLRSWMTDDTQDLSQTMAALDRGLDRLASAARTFSL